jgi:hypothetical protein
MISPATAPSAVRVEVAYSCGPVRLNIEFDGVEVQEALHGLLSQYDAPWAGTANLIRVVVERGGPPVLNPEPSGSYLHLHHLRVDLEGARLVSLGAIGVWMEFDLAAGSAHIIAPMHSDWPTLVEEIEHQLILLLSRAWALAGWTPLHAGSLIPPGENRCVLLCAPSGVGKTTLIAAMLRRGWRTLGDDKTLLRIEHTSVAARGLARRFHLYPHSSQWFPETGDFNQWPRYSRWTDKRIVQIESVWPDRLSNAATPAAVVQLERGASELQVEPLDSTGTLNTLLRQVAIPSHPVHARAIVGCLAATAVKVKSARIKIGHEAFADTAVLVRLEEIFRRLLL